MPNTAAPAIATPPPSSAPKLPARSVASTSTHPRAALAAGNVYHFKGYAPNGIRIEYVAFRGHPEDDGAAEGVCVKWLRDGGSGFYLCKNDSEFFGMLIFANLCDRESA